MKFYPVEIHVKRVYRKLSTPGTRALSCWDGAFGPCLGKTRARAMPGRSPYSTVFRHTCRKDARVVEARRESETLGGEDAEINSSSLTPGSSTSENPANEMAPDARNHSCSYRCSCKHTVPTDTHIRCLKSNSRPQIPTSCQSRFLRTVKKISSR